MKITTKAVYNLETWALLEWEGYEYVGPVALACSSGDPTAYNMEQTQAKMTATLNADYSLSFAHQMEIANQVQAKMEAMASNPLGYTPPQLAQARTSINENTATAAKQAMGHAAAYAATHGSADIGGGVTGQMAGEIGTSAAMTKAGALANLSQQNEQLKQENYWRAIGGLSGTGEQFGRSAGTSIGGATETAKTSVDFGQLNLSTKQAGWQNAMGVVAGVGGLIEAGADAFKHA